MDADGAYRTAYEGKFTLEELRSGMSKEGEDTTPFTAEQLTPESSFRDSFEHMVDHYWQEFGSKRFDEEMVAFARIRAKAVAQGFTPPAPPAQ